MQKVEKDEVKEEEKEEEEGQKEEEEDRRGVCATKMEKGWKIASTLKWIKVIEILWSIGRYKTSQFIKKVEEYV